MAARKGIASIALLGCFLAACGTTQSGPATRNSSNPPGISTVASTTSSAEITPSGPAMLADGTPFRSTVPADCKLVGDGAHSLPDPTCTPGALNPAVTPETIGSTICVSGYSTSIRPPSSFTSTLKRRQMAAWGITGSTSETEEDHLVPLSLGGAPSDSRNLWPEPGGIPNAKDQLEFRLYRMVCDGQLDLRSAQAAIATDWATAYQRWVGPLR
jgi:hypothetical protein